MADSKKYNGSTWEHSLRKFTTATDTFTTLPADLYADGNNATVGLKGNTVQSGTPTPDNPIMPQGTGERTGNLYNINAKDVNNGYVDNAQLSQDGTHEAWTSAEISEYIPISGDTAYTFNGIGSYNSPCYALYDENKQLIGAYKYSGRSTINFTSSNNARYFRFTHIKIYTQAMVVEGTYTSSRMPKFEPYGYKIPISSGGVTTNIYLGSTQTVRPIKSKVIPSDYSPITATAITNGTRFELTGILGVNALSNQGLCTHAVYSTGWNTFNAFSISRINGHIYMARNDISTVEEFREWLADQSANGTPVTVWYVLATEEAGIVNEPLRKIGEYVDTVGGITIPTITGKDTFDVLTTLKPSEVSLTYTGWHDATVKEWDGSEWE